MPSNLYSVNQNKGDISCVWWRLRTGLEKCLLCGWTTLTLLFFALCISVITIASLIHYSNRGLNVCLSRECIKEASRIMTYLDDSVPPCHNFYKFACGKWINSSMIPDESNSISTFSITQEQLNWKLRELLEEPIKPNESKTVKNVKNMYNSCMDLTVIKELGSKPLIKYLKLFGGWPVVEGELWDESKFDLIDIMSKIRAFGFENRFLFNVRVRPDFKQNTKHRIYLSAPLFSCLTSDELINTRSNKVKHYLNFMVDVAVLLGAEENKAEEEMKEVIQLESSIAKTIRRSDFYQFVTIKRLSNQTMGSMNWSQLLNAYLSLDLKIDENETLIISSFQTVVDINQIVNEYLKNNKRVLANYILWKIVFQSIKVLDKSFTETYADFYILTQRLKRNTKRWKTCLKLLSTYMKTGLTSLYLNKDDQKANKKNLVNKIFENIRSILTQKLDQIVWMDESTRLNALLKLKSINKFIAYNDELLNETRIDKVHKGLHDLKNGSLFENLLKLQKWNLVTEYSKLRTINDRNGWQNIVSTAEINAYYSPYINGIKIPIWILNGILFGVNRPSYLNYGSLGWIIGHELIHPFDNIGGRFDRKGNLRNWMDVIDIELFRNKSQCFVDQYQDNYINTEEKSTLSEDMADNGGIEIALRSYEKYIKQNVRELTLPGLNYTTDQLFWISAAQIWCSKMSHKGFKYFRQTSIHSLSERRVNIPFSNSKNFSKAFNCSETDHMNPKHKCKVW